MKVAVVGASGFIGGHILRGLRARGDDARAVVPEGTAAPARIPAEIFASAVDAYVSGQRLDMQSLARRAGVGRATLYRRAGNREQLLDEVLWWRARRLLVRQVQATAALAGVARIAAVIGGVLAAVERDKPLRAFLESDPEAAMRILTGTRSTAAKTRPASPPCSPTSTPPRWGPPSAMTVKCFASAATAGSHCDGARKNGSKNSAGPEPSTR